LYSGVKSKVAGNLSSTKKKNRALEEAKYKNTYAGQMAVASYIKTIQDQSSSKKYSVFEETTNEYVSPTASKTAKKAMP